MQMDVKLKFPVTQSRQLFEKSCLDDLQYKKMEENCLPSIREIYKYTQQNHDYNVIRKYQNAQVGQKLVQKPTKRSHYLDEEIRLNCSPGPASNYQTMKGKANQPLLWAKKPQLEPKRSNKTTYLDDITRRENKMNFPSPNHYQLPANWPKVQETPKNVSQKINFIDTVQHEANLLPGPGTYSIPSKFNNKKEDKKWSPHSRLQPKQDKSAQVGTYSPCPLQFNTFARYELKKTSSQPTLPKNPITKASKENLLPGPGTYSTINAWPGKEPLKKDQLNYMKSISKGPSSKVYYS